jgi:hypothetical protein
MPITLATARQLKSAGLPWIPAEHDLFAIPDRGLDDKIFVIADMTVLVQILQGTPAVTFHGTAEWALDYLVVSETVWVPTEEQLRRLLEQRLLDPMLNPGDGDGPSERPALRLERLIDGHRCTIHFRGQTLAFDAPDAGEAYAAALLDVMRDT